ncbi:hypothetical protein ACOBR2_04570 [Telmatobacter bradus]|uniref:hypothetical protein n=1 Tax=Telmatobacter bradus TaxID=474953 RepID=UPI003B428F9C
MNCILREIKLILLVFIFMELSGNAQQGASSWGERSEVKRRVSFATSNSAEMKSGSGTTWEPGRGQFGETWQSPLGSQSTQKSTSVSVHSSIVKASTSKSFQLHGAVSSYQLSKSQNASKKNRDLQKTNKSAVQHGKTYQSIK